MDVPPGFRAEVDDGIVVIRLPEAEQVTHSVYQPVLGHGHARRLAAWIREHLLVPPVRVTILYPPLVDPALAESFGAWLREALAAVALPASVLVLGQDVEPGAPTAPPPGAPPSPSRPPPAPIPTRRRLGPPPHERPAG